jgi:hypothetical protein
MIKKEVATAVARMVLAEVVVDYLSNIHKWAQGVLVVLVALTVWQQWWWVTGLAGFLMLAVFAVYRLLAWSVLRLAVPRAYREPLRRARGELTEEYERLDLPTGWLGILRFAWRLARGKRPHTALVNRLSESTERIPAIVDQALVDAGETEGLAALASLPAEPDPA